ncbi:hypothetical protein F53441_2275 [Fusarium austroafricanum]|uniref:Uncharacterized protein n=1 Tax=Fusarium austroafricanum TaxID=2364996 RepID=A0A8H4KQC0_9HYPO|nr:hypothetical protein F53441_2275 [Fusarium austroafricanum]
MNHSVYEDSNSNVSIRLGLKPLTPAGSPKSTNKQVSLMEQWNNYFQKGTLRDFQRLCVDLALPGDLPSKAKCRDALKSINVNIKQFLECENKPDGVNIFKNRHALIS